MVCSEGGQDPQGQKAPKCLKTLVFSGMLCPPEGGFPVSQDKVRNLKNTVWKTPFGTLRGFRGRFSGERKTRTSFFGTNFLNTPRGPGHPGKIPGTSQIPLLETQGRRTFEGGRELFGHHPFAWKTPTPPGGLRNQKVNLCALFSCLILSRALRRGLAVDFAVKRGSEKSEGFSEGVHRRRFPEGVLDNAPYFGYF